MLKRLCLAVVVGLSACANNPNTEPASLDASAMITFGSCLRQWSPQPVWQSILALQPAGFIFMGDNIYSDVGPYRSQAEPQRIATAYRDLGFSKTFQHFRQQSVKQGISIHATWDDHDYGENDGGASYPHREPSKTYFSDFFNLDAAAIGDSPALGVYHSAFLAVAGLRVQLILLDTRSFRSPLRRGNADQCQPTGIIANEDDDATILGEKQWRWLESQLREAADLRLIVSSIQLLPQQHCFEKWANFPAERRRFLTLLSDTKANGVVLLSGDRHLGEISRLDGAALLYPLYEITSSGLNSALGLESPAASEPNDLRLANSVMVDNFGSIEILGSGEDAELRLQIRDAQGDVAASQKIALEELK